MGVVAERRLFTVDEYHQLGATGVLAPDERVELIDGEIIQMPPIGKIHAGLVGRLLRLLQGQAPGSFALWVQNPVTLPPRSEPQPDLMLLRPRGDDYLGGLPEAADVLLAIEVADTTLAYDRDVKIPLYARQGIAEAWLLNASARRLEMHRDPGADGYRTVLHPDRDAVVSPGALPQVRIAIAELFAGLD